MIFFFKNSKKYVADNIWIQSRKNDTSFEANHESPHFLVSS